MRRLKADVDGVIAVSGTELAGCLTELGLIDEYELCFRPHDLGSRKGLSLIFRLATNKKFDG